MVLGKSINYAGHMPDAPNLNGEFERNIKSLKLEILTFDVEPEGILSVEESKDYSQRKRIYEFSDNLSYVLTLFCLNLRTPRRTFVF